MHHASLELFMLFSLSVLINVLNVNVLNVKNLKNVPNVLVHRSHARKQKETTSVFHVLNRRVVPPGLPSEVWGRCPVVVSGQEGHNLRFAFDYYLLSSYYSVIFFCALRTLEMIVFQLLIVNLEGNFM